MFGSFPVDECGLGCELGTFICCVGDVRTGGYCTVINTADEGCIWDVNGFISIHGDSEF